MIRNVALGWCLAALLALGVGCSGSGTPAPQAKEEDQVRQAFEALQKALKARDADKLWAMLDADSQADADRAARAIRDSYAKAKPAEQAEQEKALGLPAAKFAALKGPGFLETKRFHGKYDEIPDSKVDKVVVQGDRATVHYVEPDDDKEKLTFVREKGEWKVSLPMPAAAQP
jgi:hypothetical protein